MSHGPNLKGWVFPLHGKTFSLWFWILPPIVRFRGYPGNPWVIISSNQGRDLWFFFNVCLILGIIMTPEPSFTILTQKGLGCQHGPLDTKNAIFDPRIRLTKYVQKLIKKNMIFKIITLLECSERFSFKSYERKMK